MTVISKIKRVSLQNNTAVHVVEASGPSQRVAGTETMALLVLCLLLKIMSCTGRMVPLVETGNLI